MPLLDMAGSSCNIDTNADLSREAVPSTPSPGLGRIDGRTQLALKGSRSDDFRDRHFDLFAIYAIELLQTIGPRTAEHPLSEDPFHDPMIWRWIHGSLKRPIDS
ncbi:hypothetical protein [Bradyrhizobium liaoningense]|uniref:hypothetical protein n=1 Tax=Bradyrhizobium liaoningense TaxID=43992 RepID=UPI001BA59EC6|nr:hypothetical protein [Bradyrhizobium liaoningense]MBR0907829.1 hypothetical protein [Bradyrhizobium liaoningense]